MRPAIYPILAAVLLAASASGFSQEYNLTDGVPCTQGQPGQFQCNDGPTNATVSFAGDGTLKVVSQNDNQAGVKVACGTNGNSTFFVPGKSTVGSYSNFDEIGNFTKGTCTGTPASSVITVRSAKQIDLPVQGQQLTFTDGDPCTSQANGTFVCKDGSSVIPANSIVAMTAGSDDTAIKVTCDAGSTIYFCSVGNSAVFTQPACGGGFKSAISMVSAAIIIK
ncbi:hypothetical protein LX32DRAFT_635578 [Colletotrichum zoysiae]|uniref:Uncharacterized protein n=1 Tax=Colletotrichum zoysiae TaxID=1216348 RepID=A0AAD9M4N2_9PEZI|nr:hypothetical protein LX32DRAFT_635578 [Colletotrichum zoysiae]